MNTNPIRPRKRSIKQFNHCFIGSDQKGFTWNCDCDCGFVFCTDCLDRAQTIGVIGISHREWTCLDCGKGYQFAKGYKGLNLREEQVNGSDCLKTRRNILMKNINAHNLIKTKKPI